MQATTLLIRPEEGEASGWGIVPKVTAATFDGALFVMEGRLAPGDFVTPHTHSREDECTFVMSGRLRFEVGDETFDATAGCYVIKPRGIPHAFWNPGPGPVHAMELHTPGGLEGFYREMGEVFADVSLDNDTRVSRVGEIHGRYGATAHPERAARLAAEHGLQLPG
jgi:mannose-6-phosphate isomerase-like protein (cupin superfamily)